MLGNQLTTVAVPFQVYAITRSSLMVGLVSLAQLFPLIFGSLLGGSLVNAVDRRKLLLLVEGVCARCSAGLALNSDLAGAVAAVPVPGDHRVAERDRQLGQERDAARAGRHGAAAGLQRDLPVALQTGAIMGPAVAGLLLAGAGVHVIYWIDVASYLAAMTAVLTMSPRPPPAAGTPGGATTRPGWRSTLEGLRFVRRSQPVLGAYVIDVNAMVFGMPRALFPALAATVFGGGATTVGLLYAAPGAGALLGALTTGWVGRIRRQGLAVICAVIVWGAAIAGFGVARWLPLALVLLAVAGWADVLSSVFRNTIIQFAGPDGMRGRLMGVQMAVVAGGPRLGDLEAGAVATAFGDTASVVSGGLACVVGAFAVARALPGFTGLRSGLPQHAEDEAAGGENAEEAEDEEARAPGRPRTRDGRGR